MADDKRYINGDPGAVIQPMTGGSAGNAKTNFWSKFGLDYDSINRNLGGLPEWVRKQVETLRNTPAEQYAKEHPVIGGLEAAASGIRDTLTGGLVPAILERASPALQQASDSIGAAYPVAKGIGQGVGLAGAMAALPTGPGAGLAGLASGAPALGASAAGSATEPFLSSLGRNALVSAAAQSPASLAQAIRGESPEEIAKDAAKNIGIGALAGAAMDKVLAGAAGKIKKGQVKQHLASLGINSRDVAQSLDPRYTSTKQFDESLANLSEVLSKRNIVSDEAKEGLIEQYKNVFKVGSKVWDESGLVPSVIKNDVLSLPDIQNGVKAIDAGYGPGTGQGIIDTIFKQLDTQGDAAAVRDQLNFLTDLKLNGGELDKAKGHFASVIKKEWDDRIADMAGVDMGDAKSMYRVLLPLIKSEKREARTVSKLFTAGSPTEEKLSIANAMMKGGALGAGSGAVRGAAEGDFDPTDPVTYAKTAQDALIPGLIGAAGGGIAAKMIPEALNSATGLAAGKMAGLTPTPAQVRAAAPRVAQAVPLVAGAVNRNNTTPPSASPIPSPAQQNAPMEPGNIDLTKRTVVNNKDGSISTIRSITIEEDGKYVNIPTAIDGKIVSNKEAIDHYRKTGEHLGKWSNQADAENDAALLSKKMGSIYSGSSQQTGAQPQKPPEPPIADMALKAAAAPSPGQPSQPNDKVAKGAEPIVGREGQVSQKVIDAAKNDTSKVFAQKFTDRLTQIWTNDKYPYKESLDQFIAEVTTLTNNFDPKNANTAKIIAGDDYKDYLKTYNGYLALNALGDDLLNAIQMSRQSEWLASTELGKYIGDTKTKEDRERLIQGIYIAMTGDMKEPDAKTHKMIDEKLYELMKTPGDPQSKKARLFDMLEKQYGYRADLLKQYGLGGE